MCKIHNQKIMESHKEKNKHFLAMSRVNTFRLRETFCPSHHYDDFDEGCEIERRQQFNCLEHGGKLLVIK